MSPARRSRARGSAGQALALFGLSITVLLGMASLAVDVGRLLAQQRYLQNAADAAALAGASEAIRIAAAGGGTVGQVRQATATILAQNLTASPAGAAPITAPTTPVFAGTTSPANLADGILFLAADGSTALADAADVRGIADIRVAARSRVDFVLARVLGVNAGWVSGRAHVGLKGSRNLMPIVVRRYIGGVGPNSPTPTSCPEDPASQPTWFYDLAASWTTACTSSIDAASPYSYNGRSPATIVSPGPITQLVGEGAEANAGGVSFRGFVNLDVRDFQTAFHHYYNGLSAGSNSNSVKQQATGWVAGYPGPDLGTAPSADGSTQVGVLDGNSAGLIVQAMAGRFKPGDLFMAAMYDGMVRTTPAFAVREDVALPQLSSSGSAMTAGTFSVVPDQRFTDQVEMSLVGKPSWLSAAITTTPFTPEFPGGTALNLTGVAARNGTGAQIDTFWIRGADTNRPNNLKAPDYYLPVAVQVNNAQNDMTGKDFTWVPRSPTIDAPDPTTASVTLTLSTSTASTLGNGNTVRVRLVESRNGTEGSLIPESLPAGSYYFGTTPGTTQLDVPLTTQVQTIVSNTADGTQVIRTSYTGTVQLTVDTTLVNTTSGRTALSIPIEMTGTTTSNRPIRHLDILRVNVSSNSMDENYVEIIGYAVFKVTAIDANTVWGRVVSSVKSSPVDPALLAALTPRLIPW